jgi:hypothetical protein
MSTAAKPRSSRVGRDEVDHMVNAGEGFAEIEDAVVKTVLSDDARDPLWVYAWSQFNLANGGRLVAHRPKGGRECTPRPAVALLQRGFSLGPGLPNDRRRRRLPSGLHRTSVHRDRSR